MVADNLRICQPFYSYSTLSWVLLEISRILQNFDESLFLLTFAKKMKYKVVFSAERRKSKKSGNIIRNKRHTTTMKKCDAISTHAGRRTFICLAIELGILPVVIREWTGHSTDKAMKPYISVTNKKKAREMSKFDSF